MNHEALEREGLILVQHIGGLEDVSSISRDVGRGLLVPLRRGAYVRRVVWDRLDPRARHVLRVRAVVAAATRPVLVAGHSAAALWGMPIAGAWPNDVLLLDERQGGGHVEPGVRRTSVGVHSATRMLIDDIPVTSLARTALDVARRSRFVDAVGSVDWALWRKNPRAVQSEDLFTELASFEHARGLRSLERVISFATSLSDSFGESEARAVIHLLGFARPELQVEFRDAEGLIHPDFFWRRERVACEFDGKQKYTRNEYTHGDPGEVVWREKKREDRLRQMNVGVTRILTAQVRQPLRLERVLHDAGVPQAVALPGRRSRLGAEL